MPGAHLRDCRRTSCLETPADPQILALSSEAIAAAGTHRCCARHQATVFSAAVPTRSISCRCRPVDWAETARRRWAMGQNGTSSKVEYLPRIRDLPAADRPRERLLQYGAGSLSNAELLAILLRTGVEGESALGVAQRLLSRSTPAFEVSPPPAAGSSPGKRESARRSTVISWPRWSWAAAWPP